MIKSIQVLKGASATAIYGARGASGVLLITTISGRKNSAPEVQFNTRVGIISNEGNKYDLLSPSEMAEMTWMQYKNSGIVPNDPIYGSGTKPQIPKYLFPAGANTVDLSTYDIKSNPITESNPDGTDWYNAIYRPGITQEYSLAVSGGGDKTTYGLGVGYTKEEGELIHTGFDRKNVRINITTDATKWLQVGEHLGVMATNRWGFLSDGGASSSPFAQIYQIRPIAPVYDVMGNFSPVSRIVGMDPHYNPVARLNRRKNFSDLHLRIKGDAFAKVSINKYLVIKSSFGVDIVEAHNKAPLETNPESYVARELDQYQEGYGDSKLWSWTNTVNYSRTINDIHHFNVLLGTEAIDQEIASMSGMRQGYFSTNPDYMTISSGDANNQFAAGSRSSWALFSYFGRLQYSLEDKYFLNATLRRDGSSRFGSENRFGMFPSVSAGWIVSDEDFMESTGDWLDFLKLRLSWGQAGNDQIGNYNGFTTFSSNIMLSNYPIDGSNDKAAFGFQSNAFGNPNAKWETVTDRGIGVDVRLINHFDVTIDLWNKKTTGMLYQTQIPYVQGYASYPSVNIGIMKNTGIDFNISYHGEGLNNDLTYNLSANFSHYKNRIIKLSDRADEAIIGDPILQQSYTRAENGTSFPEFYGYKVLGIFQTKDEADKYPTAFGKNGTYNKPGRFKFADVNGDGIIDDKDRTYIGNPHPDFTAGFNGYIKYKFVDLSVFFYTSFGNDLLNFNRLSLDFNHFQRVRSYRRLYESWGSPYLKDNRDAKMPLAEVHDANDQLPSSYFVEDGSYLRLKDLSIGFNLPEKILDRYAIKKLRIYLKVSNLFTLTNYSGLDPAINSSDASFGVDTGQWPTPRRYAIGISLGL